jgi:hypothetical protein
MRHDLAFRHQRRCQADDGPPEVPAFVVEGTPEEDVEPGKVLHSRCSGQPHIGRNGVAVTSQGPATGQGGEGVPRRCSKETLKQRYHNSAKRRVKKGVHGNVRPQASLSWQMTHLTGVEVAVALHRLNIPHA